MDMKEQDDGMRVKSVLYHGSAKLKLDFKSMNE